MRINRLDVYLGTAIDEAIRIISTWGNRKAYQNDTPYQHLVRNINGWLGEEIFHVNFPEWEYINEDEHTYLETSINPAARKGEPDFKNKITGKKCEVKTYYTLEYINKKIESWKLDSRELHNADIVLVINRNEDKKPLEMYMLNTTSWKLIPMNITIKYPTWYKGFVR